MKTVKTLSAVVTALVAWLISMNAFAQLPTFRTLAGNPAAFGAMDGTNGSALFDGPSGLALDSAGNIYVADQYNDVIRKVARTPGTSNWVVTTIAGNIQQNVFGLKDGTNAAAVFDFPAGLAVDQSGNIFVADSQNNAIRKITPMGTNWIVTTIAGRGMNYNGTNDGVGTNAQFNQPCAVAVDTNDNLYVADQYNNTIRKITPSGTNWTTTTIAGLPSLDDDTGFADGTNATARFNNPTGVAVDISGRIFVADTGNNDIRLITPSGTNWVVTTIGGEGPSKGGFKDGTNLTAQYSAPAGVAVDTNDNVYVSMSDQVTDSFAGTIRKIVPVGTNWVTTTIGGKSETSGTNDGTGTNALFYLPLGVAVDAEGTLYVADTDNDTIRRGLIYPTILASGTNFGFNQSRFGFNLTGPQGQVVVVQASTNMINWLPILTNSFGNGPLPFSDPQSASFPTRFYRAELPNVNGN